jgi:hypothetical protein
VATKTPIATEARVLARKVRIPTVRKPTASTLRAESPKASNARGEAPTTSVYKSKAPKQKGREEKVAKASPNTTERQSTKPSKPSKLTR